MPFTVSRGTTVGFSIEFFDVNGALTMPSSATLTVIYPALTGGTATATVALNRGRVFTGAWDTSVSDLGFATVSVLGAGQASANTTTLRVIYP